MARRVAAEPISVAKKIGQIVSRPSQFADKFIRDHEPNALFDSIKFFIKLFALTFAVFLAVEQFSLAEGSSEVRDLLRLVPQIAIGFLVVFLLLLITGNRVPVNGLLQMILYVDAVYLLFDMLVSTPFSYLNYALLAPAGTKEVDLFTSEYAKCLSSESLAYWLIRGDLQYFMYSDKWLPTDWTQWFMSDNRRYITAIPFLFIFAQMARKKYGTKRLIAVIAAMVAFVSALAGYDWFERKALQAIANNSPCVHMYVKTILSKYSADRIAKQLEYKLSNTYQQIYQNPNLVLRLQGNEFVYSGDLQPNAAMPTEKQITDELSQFFRSSYCSDQAYRVAVRGIRYHLAASVSYGGRPMFSQRFKPEDCGPA